MQLRLALACPVLACGLAAARHAAPGTWSDIPAPLAFDVFGTALLPPDQATRAGLIRPRLLG